jgi:hypothetical protein
MRGGPVRIFFSAIGEYIKKKWGRGASPRPKRMVAGKNAIPQFFALDIRFP